MSAASANTQRPISITEVLAASTNNFSVAEKRLTDIGFTAYDLQMCADRGFPPDDVWAEVKNLMDMGLTTEAYARSTFFDEAHPELYAMEIEQPIHSPPALNRDKSEKLKCDIANFVTIMETDERYAGVRYNELAGRA